MDKLQMCRICLAEGVRMYVVVNKDLRELYETLTDIPFVTADRRPILACFFCCAKLKQCFRFMRKCLEADKLFAQIMEMDEHYEFNPLINPGHFELCSGFSRTPIEQINIVEKCQQESIAIKVELTADCEGLDDVKENQTDEYLEDVKDIPLEHSESDSVGDVPLKVFKIEVEDETEVCKKKRRAVESNNIKLENIDNSCIARHSESNLEFDVPLIDTALKETEVSKKKRRAVETNSAPATITTKPEDTITTELKNNEPSNLKVFRTTRNCTSKPGTSYETPDECDQRSLNEVKKLKQQTQTRISKKRYECDVCQRNFSKNDNLIRHIRIHTGVKPYKCDVCLRSFSNRSTLTNHIRTHTGEKPYKCDVCQLSFTLNHLLKAHIRKHTGEKLYKCDTCQRSFNEKGHLTNHIRVHTGEKPYKCDVCQRSFSEKGHLTNHIRIHTGLKPYECDVCRRSFTRKSHLTRHIIRKQSCVSPTN